MHLLIKRLFAIGAPVVINKALCQRRPQPAQQRAPPAIGVQRTLAFAVARIQPIKLRIESVCQIAPHRFASADRDGRACEGLAVSRHEMLPCSVVSNGTCLGQHQVRQLQTPKYTGVSQGRSRGCWCKVLSLRRKQNDAIEVAPF